MSRTGARQATEADCAHVARTLALGFQDDPVWGSWMFPDPAGRVDRLTTYWVPWVRAALKYDGVWLTADRGAVAVWVPPGVQELDDQDQAAIAATVEQLCGDRAPLVLDAYERFEAAYPQHEPSWYLSLLATHPDHRGRGLAMDLVADHLETVDAQHLAVYLESTNDGNLARYRRAGFEPHGSFDLLAGPTVTTMWRPAR